MATVNAFHNMHTSEIDSNMTDNSANDKSIGDIIRQANNLSSDQVSQVLAYQKEQGVKFGEAAVALGLIKREDVLWALSQQFRYAYSGQSDSKISSELVVASKPFGDEAESFRDIRSHLISGVLNPQETKRALAVVSPNVGDGKSFFAANLAVGFSQLGGRTLLVDADMRTPRQQEIFGIEEAGLGLSGVLSGRAESNVIRPVDDLPSLYVMPVGVVPPNPLELVQGPAFSLLISELLLKFDYVVVDTPAAIHGSDARVIASKCGAALFVGRQGGSSISASKALLDSLAKMHVRIAGAVMNQI